MDREFEIAGRKFQLNKLNVKDQLKIARRVTPILAELLPALKDLSKIKEGQSQEQNLDDLAKFAAPIMIGYSKLSDDDADIVLFGLCSAVEVYQDRLNCWSRVSTMGQLVMNDLELPVLFQLAGRSFMYSMASFFPGAQVRS